MQIQQKRGFTLIELLVVVVIIGILAAVALPQYQLAVVKARTKSMLALLKNIQEAENVYYLTHGDVTYDHRTLDIEMPGSCQLITEKKCNGAPSKQCTQYQCENVFTIDFALEYVILNYCPRNSRNMDACQKNRDFSVLLGFSPYPDTKKCKSFSELGKKICKSFW